MISKNDMDLLIASAISSYQKYPISNKQWVKASYIINVAGGIGLFYYLKETPDPQPLNTKEGSSGRGFDNDQTIAKILANNRESSKSNPNTRWNKGTITIYPDGRYESEFIWDQQAHIDFRMKDLRAAFSFLYSESDIKITDALLPGQEWEKAVIIMPFVNGHILPLQIEVTTKHGIKQFSLLVQNLTYEEAPYLIKRFEDIYQLANEGELKQHFAPGWNTVVIYQNRLEFFDFEQHVKFDFRNTLLF
ncbi:hypothetical protein [Xanthocytophaga flava]|uniref:hypothetical protein n=1 Tax=Xanthocytophaga flava TaxID=3048013 RepID=UPI0028D2E8D8|nr:hypothetical protein [Xanthocytophaga flavus]MDJ1472533.1 hypothetical protein [Xanthocytophaga flavus]